MSYRSRQKKRAIAAAKRDNHEKIATRWYLTIVKRKTCCAKCGGILKVGADMVYRRTPRESRCRLCAESDPSLSFRPSERWEKSRRR